MHRKQLCSLCRGATLCSEHSSASLQDPFFLQCLGHPTLQVCDQGIDAVVVGADRVVANGDTANKIGTYQLAIAAKYHGAVSTSLAPLSRYYLDLPLFERVHAMRMC